MANKTKYREIMGYIKERIQTGNYAVGSFLPSENELCQQFNTTRTTVRRALEELLREGFIQKEHGRGSKVLERSKSLGLLTVKGFSGAIDYDVNTVISVPPNITSWPTMRSFALSDTEEASDCVYFQRIRNINGKPVVVEDNWYAASVLEPIDAADFVEGSFFKTLSQKHLIEIMGAEQELRAITATAELAKKLQVAVNSPILHITVRFRTSLPELNLYGALYCTTTEYPIRNSYSV
ncbi:GntR family transcriptional regulator [Maribacter sp. 2307ULW6-5]|uniref:GntR family transcriptional regulator n=1 Tax=Maribacter sp. 2307ULW6-5 TaxID=3386275 RepID=UPI0039BC53DF